MNKLEFLDWKSAEQTFDFLGWNSGRAASAFIDSAAFVLDEMGQRKILQLRLPFLKPAIYQCDPFPPHPPTRIEKFRLRPPPCRPSKGEAEDLLAFAQGGWRAVKHSGGHFTFPDAWEVVYGEVLNPTPDDEPELRKRMEKQKEAHRREYESRKQELAGRTDESATREAATLEEIYNAPLRRLEKDGPLMAGYLNVSLDLVKEGGDLLNQHLHEWWAERNGFDLGQMSQEAKVFLRQWAELTTEITDSRPTQGGGRITTKLQNWAGWHQKGQELLALVVYRIHFADGRRFWLSGCTVRDLQTPEETREFSELLAGRRSEAPPPIIALTPLPISPFMSVTMAMQLTGRSDRWLRDECKRRGWRTTKLTLEKVTELAQEAKRRDANKSRAMQRRNDKSESEPGV